ncbi:MAG TPA: hypothetical protein VGE45_13630 [Chloroflexia bacterium]
MVDTLPNCIARTFRLLPAKLAAWGIITSMLLLLTAGTSSWAPMPYATAAPDRQYFAATGHFLEGKFLQYWQSHGGLPVFGYPLTPAFFEGGYLVQYFERSRFELHPEHAGSAYEVLLGQLGSERLRREGRTVPRQSPADLLEGKQFFPETGYMVGGPFLAYWREHGGLAQFGYPITPELPGGTEVQIVQYFERARFELHPELAGTEYVVLLSLLGAEHAFTLDPSLRAPWSADAPFANLRVEAAPGVIPILAPVLVTSEVAGELRVLDGDNRVYATYPLEAGVPLTIYTAGAPGLQSLMLYRQGEAQAALWGDFSVGAPQWGVWSGDPGLDGLYPRIKGYLDQDAVVYNAPSGKREVRGYRSPDNVAIWLRDHVHQSKGFKFFERDMTSTLDYFASTQRPDGSFDDYLFHTLATPVFTDQIEIEADREYLFVEGAWTAWQATGDDEWLRGMLPTIERGLEHLFRDPRRWSPDHALIKRGFTIDTWDFEQGSNGEKTRRDLDEQTRWSIMHGDNTGAYHAARLIARIERRFGRDKEGADWDARADALLWSLNHLLWNGQFYTHQLHLTPIDPVGVDESTQLSLSNAYALNRGTLTQEQAASVIRTYQARREANASRIFAEWYSIDPPFPSTFGLPPGEYVNGGVMPLVGGELARGAFEYGFEAYGVDILRRYWELLDRTGGSYLWYHPDGSPGVSNKETLATDGWGGAAMLNALTEGLAGVVDEGKLYEQVRLSPRWPATDRKSAQVALSYGTSGAYFAYAWQHNLDGSLSLAWGGRQTRAVRLHMLLPQGMSPRQALLNGASVPFVITQVGESRYLDVALPGLGRLDVR